MALDISQEIYEQAVRARDEGYELSPQLTRMIDCAPPATTADLVLQRSDSLLSQAVHIAERAAAGEGASAGVELDMIRDEMLFLTGLLRARLAELSR